MNKQTLFVTLTTAALMCGCQSSKVKISGRFVGGDAKNIYLEQVLPLTQSVVDSAALAPDGSYRMELTGVAKTPSLYNVIYDGERIPLLLAGGDRLTLGSVGSVIRNYTVEGSSESELLRQFYQAFVTGAQQLENMGTEFARKLTDEERKSLIKEYTAEYYRIRREQLRFIIEHKASLAAVYALYQRLPGDTYLFNGDSDVVYYRTVAEALQESYPESPYLQSLQAEIARMDARISLTSQITEARHPDLELTDIYGKKIRLSSLAGKVVLLDFWSAELGSSNALNADLKELYRKYADAPVGFEVYQVAVDTSKPLWITAVQEQQLPFVRVPRALQRAAAPGQLPDRQGGDDRGQEHLRQEPRSETGRADKIESCIISHPTSTWEPAMPRRHGRSKDASWRGSTTRPGMRRRSFWSGTSSISGSNTAVWSPRALCGRWASWPN